MSVSNVLGQAAYVNKGAYSSSVSYAPLNTVYYNGGTWVALTTVSNVTPGSDNTKWLCITQGLRSFSVAAGNTGYMNVTFVLTDGTTATTAIPVGAIGDGTITVSMLASAFTLPVAQGGTGATTASGALTSLGAQKAIQKATPTLAAASWTQSGSVYTQDATVSGMTSGSEFIASPNTAAGWDAAADANLYPPTPGTNKLTFTCKTVPSVDIPLTVYWW